MRAGQGSFADLAVVVEPGGQARAWNGRRHAGMGPAIGTNSLNTELTPVIDVPGECSKIAIENGVVCHRLGKAHGEVYVVK